MNRVQNVRGKKFTPHRLRNLSWRKYWFFFISILAVGEYTTNGMLQYFIHGYARDRVPCTVCGLKYHTFFILLYIFIYILFSIYVRAGGKKTVHRISVFLCSPLLRSSTFFGIKCPSFHSECLVSIKYRMDFEQNEECARFPKIH